jgi:hypothetical protein
MMDSAVTVEAGFSHFRFVIPASEPGSIPPRMSRHVRCRIGSDGDLEWIPGQARDDDFHGGRLSRHDARIVSKGFPC